MCGLKLPTVKVSVGVQLLNQSCEPVLSGNSACIVQSFAATVRLMEQPTRTAMNVLCQ